MRSSIAPCLVLLVSVALACQAAERSTVVAKVEGTMITVKDVQNRLQEYRTDGTPDPTPFSFEFKKNVLNELIEETAIAWEAKRREIKIAEEELDKAIKDVEQDYPDDSFKKILADQGVSYERWKSQLRFKLLLAKVTEELSRDVPPPQENMIWAYFEKRKEDFQQQAQVHLEQIVVKTKEDGELILAELEKGRSFGELARTYSFTPEANQGGNLGFVSKGVMPPQLEKAIFKLKVGKPSRIIESEYGFHVVRILEKRPEKMQTYEEARPKIIAMLTRKDREVRFSNWRQETLPKMKIERNHALLKTIP